jgi:hypothetical protein
MSGKSSDKFYKTVVFAEDMTDTMLEKVLATARDGFQLQVTVRHLSWSRLVDLGGLGLIGGAWATHSRAKPSRPLPSSCGATWRRSTAAGGTASSARPSGLM